MHPVRKYALGAAILATSVTGGALGAAALGGSAGAQSADSSTSTQQSTDQPDPSQGGHTANGITEELLTGDVAAKVQAAAEAAVPGGTVDRVENDAEGSPYEAHVTKSDGSHVTVKVADDFSVTGIEDGPGGPR